MTGTLPAWLLTCYKGSPRLRLAHFLPRDTLLAGVHVLSDSAKWRTARETALYLLSTKQYDTKSTPGQICLIFAFSARKCFVSPAITELECFCLSARLSRFWRSIYAVSNNPARRCDRGRGGVSDLFQIGAFDP